MTPCTTGTAAAMPCVRSTLATTASSSPARVVAPTTRSGAGPASRRPKSVMDRETLVVRTTTETASDTPAVTATTASTARNG